MDNKNQLEFFSAMGLDAAIISVDDITNLGYYTFVVEQDGRRLTYGHGEVNVREFHPWPLGELDWSGFKQACRRDFWGE